MIFQVDANILSNLENTAVAEAHWVSEFWSVEHIQGKWTPMSPPTVPLLLLYDSLKLSASNEGISTYPTGYFSFYGPAVRELTQKVRNFSSSSSSWENSTPHSLWLVEALAPRKHDLITAPKLKWLVQEAALAFHQLWFAEREEK